MAQVMGVAPNSSSSWGESLSVAIQQNTCGLDMASCGPLLASRPRPVAVCQLARIRTKSADLSRRSFVYRVQLDGMTVLAKTPSVEKSQAKEDELSSTKAGGILSTGRKRGALKTVDMLVRKARFMGLEEREDTVFPSFSDESSDESD